MRERREAKRGVSWKRCLPREKRAGAQLQMMVMPTSTMLGLGTCVSNSMSPSIDKDGLFDQSYIAM